jgi:hypothetical protein
MATQSSASSLAANLNNGTQRTDPAKYVSLGDFLTTENAYNNPDVREMLVKTFGDQGITGFLTLTGATKNAGQADQVEYFEERRRHKRYVATGAAVVTAGVFAPITFTEAGLQKYDVIMKIADGERFLVTASAGGVTASLRSLGATGRSATAATAYEVDVADGAQFALVGNMYPQGSDQPTIFTEPGIDRRINPFAIIKERFQVSGSQATNIGYINVGNGDYRWFMYGEQEARKRFMDKREMTLLFGDIFPSGLTGGQVSDVRGTEGYFAAVETRGNIISGAGSFALSDVDNIIIEMDKQGAPSEYAMYLGRALDLEIDDLLATGLAGTMTTGLPSQFGAFNNSPEMAVNLGFKSFTRGGYTFHKHSWKLLNDPTLVAGSPYLGAIIPMAMVADARTGVKSPALEMNYKASNGYSREMEHWVTGGGVLGYNNNGDAGKDVATFHYRSEVNLVTRAANQHFVLKS